jgi:hypothetical protein
LSATIAGTARANELEIEVIGKGTMKVMCGVLIFCIVQMGCSSSYVVSSSQNADKSFSTFNADAYDRSGFVVFQDGTELDAKNIVASTDSTRFVNEKTNETTVVPTHTIKKAVFKNRGVGFLEGFGFGALAGVPTGVCLAVFGFPKGELETSEVIGIGLMGGLLGGLMGGIPGFVIGHSYEYTFPIGEESTKK